jgi:hypothetical protein
VLVVCGAVERQTAQNSPVGELNMVGEPGGVLSLMARQPAACMLVLAFPLEYLAPERPEVLIVRLWLHVVLLLQSNSREL